VADRDAAVPNLDPVHGVNRHADWAAIAHDLHGLNLITGERQRRALSKDFHWYSPILAEQLAGCVADLVVKVSLEADVIRVAAVAAVSYTHLRAHETM
jgi:hypothetical protein